MGTIISLNENQTNANTVPELPGNIKLLIAERQKAKREPITPEKLRQTPGLENLSDAEAEEIVETIGSLTKILFNISCYKEVICIDNQHIVSLSQNNKAA